MGEVNAQNARLLNAVNVKDATMHETVRREQRRTNTKADSLRNVERALGIDYETMKNLHRQNRYRSAYQLVFCFVIMGCELDLIGFCLAFMGYWKLGHVMVKACLVAFPASYVLCIGSYFFFLQPDERAAQTGVSTNNAAVNAARLLTVRPEIKLEWYHFLPLARYMLLIKSTTQDDIEGIFKVNSLSSFTLGSCQIVGMIFTVIENGNSVTGLDIFVYMNVVSFVINWLITLAYFRTNIAKTMKDVISGSAYRSNVSAQMRYTVVQLLSAITTDAETVAKAETIEKDALSCDEDDDHHSDGQDGPYLPRPSLGSRSTQSCGEGGRHLEKLRRKLQEEIRFFKQADINLRYFDPIELLTMRRAIYLQNAHHFEA